MISIKLITIALMLMANAHAFTPQSSSSSQQPSPAVAKSEVETTRLQFLQKAFTAAGATSIAFIPQSSSAASSSTISDPFALPSYSDAIKNKSVEMNLEEVNKKILDDAASKRDDSMVNKEGNDRYIQLKMEEAEEEKRLERMRELARREREERIAAEKAETKANRWNTF